MLTHPLIPIIHDGAIGTLILALAIEYLIFRRGLTMVRVRRLLLVDGIAALALFSLFVTGCLLVLAQARTMEQLLAHPEYLAKAALFLLIVATLDYPSRLFYRWRRSLRSGKAPMISTQQHFRVVWILRSNLLLVALLVL
ncbi:DUF2214 family protein [Aeromonas enteropelogenes]|uniref:DUF2214 family protein n=1 Tax=Aeromonas enteropelogenes TaxID=29489 RepID=UPI001CE33BAD|nr:DUF2214 family protein [Aeromonas enteropelogenes]UCA11860.1 DUF2214 family protein [Aeromonas enteropelogenes]